MLKGNGPLVKRHEVDSFAMQGMGEPLHNADNVIRAANIMLDDHGLHLSHNKVTVSTSGLVPQIKQFYKQSGCSLAVSLNATTDEVLGQANHIHLKFGCTFWLKVSKIPWMHQ
jgi:23S rRNA (adenine2503-C2)-methyltransferase